METAPLTLAYNHARNAVAETKRANSVAASEEHDLAAAEYAAAAQGIADPEASRVLELLEQHHKKLSQILRTSHEKPAVEDLTHDAPSSTTGHKRLSSPSNEERKDAARFASSEATTHPPRLSRTVRPNARDLSSSIASNLASARGIPAHRQKKPMPASPLVSNQHADGQFAQEDSRRKSLPQESLEKSEVSPRQAPIRPSWAPPVNENVHKPIDDKTPTEPQSDAPFQQFYSTFESLISKLSAPLAFAGLPLTTPTPKPSVNPAQPITKAPKPPTPRAAEPTTSVDYSQLISRAALRAVHSNAPGGPTGNPSESFYVVPTTGGTFSYADIMNRIDREESRTLRHHRQTSNLSHITDDDFVDARSTILPDRSHPPSKPRTGGLRTDEPKVNGKTMEELALDNEALKHLSDTLSKRLHVFEMSAQTSSAALAQSIRSLQRSPLSTPENSRGKVSRQKHDLDSPSSKNDDQMARRVAELEEILRKGDARARKKDEENAKLRDTIVKYRDKWDSLKAGAKARREGQLQTTKDRDRAGGSKSSKKDDEGNVLSPDKNIGIGDPGAET